MDSARDALIVAVADYRDPKLQRLRAPAADAEALGRVLADTAIGGFRVELALDEDESKLSRHLARFFADRRPDDLLLVHFSCHGIKDASGELYLAAADTESDLLSATGIPSRWLNEQIGHCRSKRVVVLLDCCFSGSFPFGMSARAGGQVNVQDHLLGRGRVVITASNAMEYSFEGDELSGAGRPSVFTSAVVEGLETGKADRDGDRRVSVDDLYDYVYDRVRETTPHQSPTKLSSLEGPLYIAHSSYERPVEPAALPQELIDLTQHPYAGARLSAVEELSSLLSCDNRGIALAARLALERLSHDDSRRVAERAQAVLTPAAAARPEGEIAQPDWRETVEQEERETVQPEQPETVQPEDRETVQPEEREIVRPGPELEPILTSGTGEVVPDATLAPDDYRVLGSQPPAELTGLRVASAGAVIGAIMVIASILLHNPLPSDRAHLWYRIPVAAMAVGVILLIWSASGSSRGARLRAAAGLALFMLGVTFPMSWPPGPLPRTGGFWLGACGAALAAGAAAFLAYKEARSAGGDATRRSSSRITRFVFAIPGPLIVIGSLFVLPEWADSTNTTWDNWKNDAILRYPASMILLSGVVIALSWRGIRLDRRRLLVMAAGVACLVLGESTPLIFTSDAAWGTGRWLRILGAAVAIAGLIFAAATTRDAVRRAAQESV
jgi:Caspase domain